MLVCIVAASERSTSAKLAAKMKAIDTKTHQTVVPETTPEKRKVINAAVFAKWCLY